MRTFLTTAAIAQACQAEDAHYGTGLGPQWRQWRIACLEADLDSESLPLDQVQLKCELISHHQRALAAA